MAKKIKTPDDFKIGFIEPLMEKFPDVTVSFESSKQEMPLEEIEELEDKTFTQFENLLQHVQPHITFVTHEEEWRNTYGMGGLTADGFINGHHTFVAQVWAGKKEGKDVQLVTFHPIYEDSFDDSESYSSKLEEWQDIPVDPVQNEKYAAIKELISTHHNLFVETFNKDNLDFFSLRTHLEENKEDATDIEDGYEVTVDFKDPDFVEKTKIFVAAVQEFVDQFDFLEPLYTTVKYKYGAITASPPDQQPE